MNIYMAIIIVNITKDKNIIPVILFLLYINAYRKKEDLLN